MKSSMLLYGRNSVYERLKANPRSIRKMFLEERLNLPEIENSIKANNIPVERLTRDKLSGIKHAKDLQGLVAKVDKFKYASFDDFLACPVNKKITPIFLDRINDPQNLGVIIRLTACFGGFFVVIPAFEACEVTEAVLHVASGGENYVPVSKVPNLSNAIIKIKKKGYWIAGATVRDDAENINKAVFPFPLGLVLGSEGKGIRHGLENRLDMKVRIPMDGAKLSFNVSMACAIFCHEIAKQRSLPLT